MAITRWNKNREVETVQSRGNSVFRSLNGGEAPAAVASFVPAVDTHEDARKAVLNPELPGAGQRDPDVRLEDLTPLTAAWNQS